MELKNVSKLSDNQLVELYRNPITITETKKAIIDEIDSRKLNLSQIQEANKLEEFNNNDKLVILFLSPLLIFSVILFIIFHHKFLKNWNRKKYKQFWKLTSYGIGIYIIVFFIFLTFIH